jgi:serine/threonine protein kinase
MSLDWTGSASSDVVMRCYAPPVLAEPYRHVVSGWGSARDQLFRRLGFVEILLRYLVVVLSAELGSAPCPPYERLLQRGKGSMGNWHEAAEALARQLSERPGTVAPEISGILVDTFAGQFSRTRFSAKVAELVTLRNQCFHSHGSTGPSEREAADMLPRIREPLRVVLNALAALRDYPVFCVDRYARSHHSAKLLRFTPAGVETFEQPVLRFDLDERKPFLVSRTGDVLRLEPWLEVVDEEGRLTVRMRSMRLKADRTVLKASLPRPDAVLPGVFSPDTVGHLRGASISARQPEIEGYAIDGRLGTGGTGTVWMACSTATTSSQRVAVKLLHEPLVADRKMRARIRREYEFLAKQQHPSIVGVRDYGESPVHGPYLVMEYVPGIDLGAVLLEGPLEPDWAARICVEVLEALAGPHSQGHVHRDLKPSNLIVDSGGRVRIIDFGIAAVDGATQLTGTHDRPGTHRYMAPEQFRGRGVDGRTDLYALGATLRDLVLGLEGSDDPDPEQLPPGLSAIVRKAMHDDQADRFQDAAQMCAAFEARVQERWGGAPVLEYDRLNPTYAVRSSLMRVGPHAWLFEGTQLSTDGQVGILLTAGPEAGNVLGDAHRACARKRRFDLRYENLFFTDMANSGQRHRFAVFDGLMDLEQRVHDFLGPRHLAVLRGVDQPAEPEPQGAMPAAVKPAVKPVVVPRAEPRLGPPIPAPKPIHADPKVAEAQAKAEADAKKADIAARKSADTATKAAGVATAVGAAAVVAGVATLAGRFMKAKGKAKAKKKG